MAQQQRDGHQQAGGRVVHGQRNAVGQRGGAVGRIQLRNRGEGRDQADHGAQQAGEHADVGERAQVVRAFLEARHDLEQRLFHRLLDVVAAARGGETREAVLEHGADLGLRVVRERDGLLEVAGTQVRSDLIPQRTVTRRLDGEIQPAFDRNRDADQEDDDEWPQEEATLLEEYGN